MTKTVKLSHWYDVPPAKLWDIVTDYDALAEVCQPLLAFEGLPEGRVREGQDFTVKVRLFGRLPAQDYRMRVVRCDDKAMQFESDEVGAGVKTWQHLLNITPEGSGSRLDENITLDAGVLTPLFALWARKLYSHRDGPRRVLLGLDKKE
ncbi:SRPBCC family protein [Marivivens donghaensis]|uniref:SRPBCC family protein n=1 Tax=Marivivens donghaensis TaxID=1699413 RepID=A0ABX0W1M0_9RHOB|nr:SRPBCC family protein [Marivivens donghaensis]NIY73890.1 SRPBCC family protein [Marivivens donghaensis]